MVSWLHLGYTGIVNFLLFQELEADLFMSVGTALDPSRMGPDL